MAKVEMMGNNWSTFEYGRSVPNAYASISLDESANEYADKTWDEYVTFSIIEELVSKRKVIQRKLDAARKKLKRLANRLNTIEHSWNPA